MCDDSFEVVVHHGGYFEMDDTLNYSNGEMSTLSCDQDMWSFFEIMGILREMGYVNIKELWYKFRKFAVLENNLQRLSDDKGATPEAEIRIEDEGTNFDHIVSEGELHDVSVHYQENLSEGDEEKEVEDEGLEFDYNVHVDMHDRGLFDGQ